MLDIKKRFLFLLDGIPHWDDYQLVKGLDSYTIGICKLHCNEDALHVYLRRPGLLIGKYGKTIALFKKELEFDIVVHEFNLVTN